MSNIKTKKIECILRLINRDMFIELKEYLIENKFVKEDDFRELTRDFEQAAFIYTALNKAAADEKLILLDYEWVLLPKEYIKIICITGTEKKEFTYGI